MPLVKISHIVSWSSEEDNHRAENILTEDTKKTWRCKSGEKSASVVLQLDKATLINGIDIGNDCSAFVEVLVGKSSSPNDQFQVLLIASSFMSPMESRNVTNMNRVRMFGPDKLSKDIVEQKWDRVKIVCTQPFNKHISYGISFITLRSPDIRSENQPGKIGRFLLKDDNDDDISVGSLFAKRKEKPPLSPLTGPAAIREAANPATLAKTESSPKREKKLNVTPVSTQMNNDRGKHKTEERIKKTVEKPKHPVSSKPTANQDTISPSKKRNAKVPEETNVKKPKKEDNRQRKPFYMLLDGVVFVMSGYQNPIRGNLRAMAIQMGAKYRPDWGPGCTHLICAFQNTPKFKEVRGKGRIVTKDWIEECHSQRKRLPWRRFALDKKDKDRPESESEILEGEESDDDESMPDLNKHSAKHSEDKPEKNLRTSMFDIQPSSSSKTTGNDMAVADVYDADTDVDSDTEKPDMEMKLPDLPNIFDKKSFIVGNDISSDERKELARYIIAYKGKVIEDGHVDYIITNGKNGVKQLKAKYPGVPVVSPQWVWECNDLEKLVPTAAFTVQ